MAGEYPGNIRELKQVCEQILVWRGDSIFSKKVPSAIASIGTFDYKRFVWEFGIWDQFTELPKPDPNPSNPFYSSFPLNLNKYKQNN